MRFRLLVLLTATFLIAAITLLVILTRPDSPSVPPPPATAASTPATRPAQPPRELPDAPVIQAYADLLRTLPGMADAAVGDEKLAIEQAARVHLSRSAYICPRRDLWISHPDAPPLASVPDEGTRALHLSREEVVFVHWYRSGRVYRPLPVYRDAGGACLVHRRSAAPTRLHRADYHWDYAISLADGFAVPTDRGVSFVRVTGEIVEEYQELSEQPSGIPAIEPTRHGFLAWVPASRALSGRPAVWYSNGAWRELPASWSGPFLHLAPFADGSVLQIIAAAPGTVRLEIATLETTPPDAQAVERLVAQLADEDPAVRDAAHAQLVSMGPAAWQLLSALLADAQGEARIRLEEITRSSSRPVLGRFELIDDQLRPIWRLRDGAVFLAERGVRVRSGGVEEEVTPAWVTIRRGRPIELLGPSLARHLAVGAVDVYSVGNEWVISDAATGAQLFFGQELLPLTREADRRYRRLVGIDRQSRVLLASVDATPGEADLLLIDPWVADPTPLLQIWTMSAEGGAAGWTDDDWPALQRGGAFALERDGWNSLKSQLHTDTPSPTTRPGAQGAMRLLATASNGARIWTDDEMLEIQDPDGTTRSQRPAAMPGNIIGAAVAGDRVYVVHSGSAITRLRMNPAGDRPFTLDAIFTEDIPYLTDLTRVWADPAGRICITTADARLFVIFTGQKIPGSILDLIPDSELKRARPSPGVE